MSTLAELQARRAETEARRAAATKHYNEALQHFTNNDRQKALESCKRNLQRPNPAPFWQFKTCPLIVSAAGNWWEAELYLKLATLIHTGSKRILEPMTSSSITGEYPRVLNTMRDLLDESHRAESILPGSQRN